MADEDPTPRQDFSFSLTTADKGKINLKLYDRINVDDVFLHMVHRRVYHILSGSDSGYDVPVLYKQFLLKERFTAGQN